MRAGAMLPACTQPSLGVHMGVLRAGLQCVALTTPDVTAIAVITDAAVTDCCGHCSLRNLPVHLQLLEAAAWQCHLATGAAARWREHVHRQSA